MTTIAQLGHVVTACKIASAERWQRATKLGAGDLTKTLDALAAFTPEWWTPEDGPDPPEGLTDYQRGVLELWLENRDPHVLRQLAVNQFLLLEKLGQGGQGAVFRARQLNPPRFVAIKILTQDTEKGRQRFEQEARAMMKVRHPGVARFYLYERLRDASAKPTDEYLIAMEYVRGTDLHRMIKWLGSIPWRFVVRWAIDLLGGLAAIHESGFVHRDIKPANVMVIGPPPEPGVRPSDSAAKLLDFGAAKSPEVQGPTAERQRVFVGTREYAPPEQWTEHVVAASDLYALGATLFEALTGHPPYQVPDRDATLFRRAHARAPIPDASAINPDVPPRLGQVLTKMLAKESADRGTPDELIELLREIQPAGDRVDRPKPVRSVRPIAEGAEAVEPRPEPIPGRDAESPPAPGFVEGVFRFFERLYLPRALRPVPGQEPPAAERVIALLRRPLALVTLAIAIGVVLYLLFG